jgi:hypothetical protein
VYVCGVCMCVVCVLCVWVCVCVCTNNQSAQYANKIST